LSELLKNIDLTLKEYVNANVDIDDSMLYSIEEMLNTYLLCSPYSNYEKAVNIVKNIYNKFSDDKIILEILDKIVKFYNQYNELKIDIADITKEEIKTQESKKEEKITEKLEKEEEVKDVKEEIKDKIREKIAERRVGRKPKVEKQKRERKRYIEEKSKIEPEIEKVVDREESERRRIPREEIEPEIEKVVDREESERRRIVRPIGKKESELSRKLRTTRFLKKHNIVINYDKYLDKFVFHLLNDKSYSDQVIKKEINAIFRKHMDEITNFVFSLYDVGDIKHRLNTVLYAVIKQNLFVVNLVYQASKVLQQENREIIRVNVNVDKNEIIKLYKTLIDKMLEEERKEHKKHRKHKKHNEHKSQEVKKE